VEKRLILGTTAMIHETRRRYRNLRWTIFASSLIGADAWWRRIGIAVPVMSVVPWVLIVGCSLNRVGREEVSAAIERHFQDRSATAERYARTPAVTETPAVGENPAVEESSDSGRTSETSPQAMQAPATLREFIVRALEVNPEIQAAREVARARAERIPQVTALPDPILRSKTLPEPVRTAEGDNFFILGVSQKLPAPEKLDRRGRIALEETRMALERLRQTRIRVIADVKRAYFQLYILGKSIEITEANQNLMHGLIDVARAQVTAGRRRQDDVLRAQTELSNLEAERIALRQRRVTVVAKLNELLSRPSTMSIDTPEDFEVRQVDLTVEALFSKAIKANPELKGLEWRMERDRRAIELAKLAHWPDFTIGFEWMPMDPRGAFKAPINPATGRRPVTPQLSEDGSDNWAIIFGFNLPIWFDKIKAGEEESRRNLSASKLQFAAARNRVRFQIEDALERVRSQQQLADLFQNTIIPQAEQTYYVSQASYTAGASDFLYVMDNWRKWLVFTIQYYRSLGELERSVADLEQALGVSLSEMGAP